jgi:alkylhydroperoxidase family enzyme
MHKAMTTPLIALLGLCTYSLGSTATLAGTPDRAPNGGERPAMTETSPPAKEGRIRPRGREEMTPQEQAEYDADPLKRVNLSRLFSLAPSMAPGLTEMNKGMATGLTVPPEEREIVAFAVLNLERGEWELAQHHEVVKMMGIAPAKVDAVVQERYGDPAFTTRERALLAFTRQVVKAVRVDDATFNAVAAFYDRRQIVETLFVIGNYMMLARISEVAELPIEGTVGASFWKKQAQ